MTARALIDIAISKGAVIYSNISGGKDGQAMTAYLMQEKLPVKGLVHADLGRAEWPQSLHQCEMISIWEGLPLTVVHRSDNLDLVAYIERRKEKLIGTGKPFWPSSSSRYCTSDTKRGPINVFYNSTDENFLISAEGIRADESPKRAKKKPLSIRSGSSEYYKGMSVKRAIASYRPDKKLWLNWYPIFKWKVEKVWNTYGNTSRELQLYREYYKKTGKIAENWKFHPAYLFGNERVSCSLCVLATDNDIRIGAKHNPRLAAMYMSWEEETGITFKGDKSLIEILKEVDV